MKLVKGIHPFDLKTEYTHPIFPFGRCLNLGPGMRTGVISVDYLKFLIISPNTTDDLYVRVVFKDPINGVHLKPIGYEMRGDEIKLKTTPDSRLLKMQTSFSLFEHVKNDPQSECHDYSINRTYSDCIEEELVEKFHGWLGCHPPLISRKTGFCNKRFNLTKGEQNFMMIQKTLRSIIDDYQPITCKRPCTKFIFETKRLYEVPHSNEENGIKIVFDKTVDYTKTSFLIGVPSLLTGLGGAVAGGRTLMWCIVTVLGFISFVFKIKI